jgi:integrase
LVYLTPLVVNALQRFRAHQHAELGRAPDGWLLSHGASVTPIKPQNLGGLITQHCSDLGFDGASPHSFRRLTASELVAAGVDVTVGADRMVPTAQMMLGKYATVRKDKAVGAAAALEDRLVDQGLPMAELFR